MFVEQTQGRVPRKRFPYTVACQKAACVLVEGTEHVSWRIAKLCFPACP